MGIASEHVFQTNTAAPALMRAMKELSENSGRSVASFEGQTLGQIYEQVATLYGKDIPGYWRNWKTWDDASDDPAPMGEL